MEQNIELKIKKIVEETTQFDFPFLASRERKKAIVLEKKIYIDNKLKSIMQEKFPSEDELKRIWEESVNYADEQFKSLSDNKKLNGFYLQELCNYYAKKVGNII